MGPGGATAVALLLKPAPARGWISAALAFPIPAPYILYSYLAIIGNPEVQRWTFHSKNALPPETISFLLAIAPQLLLALVGIPGALRRRTREVTGTQRLADGRERELTAAALVQPLEGALSARWLAVVALAAGLLLTRL